ncbi:MULTISPECIES: CARDB domain-containing protein [Calothrix]|uniref:Tandem-95 repeat protein n=2 Tax=Calothrix TaxID=1186 RepID=A0ABR8AP49_9CYAN|nr:MULTISPECIES: CARDB domain-containing protein [Calothrix]MBD2200392.1 tandem-95 repeat protein [Calothrix parietina FACHB-288]MBD2229369.1 tandem-95 repeat protein [Calothrix anomala FACHB-343]
MDINPIVPLDLSQDVKIVPPDILTQPVFSAGTSISLPTEVSQLSIDSYSIDSENKTTNLQTAEISENDPLTGVPKGEPIVLSAIANTDLPDLVVTNVTVPAITQSDTNFSVSWTVLNQGKGTTTDDDWFDSFYLSTDQTFNADADIRIATSYHLNTLAPNASETLNVFLSVPNINPGDYYLFVATDYSSFSNNIQAESDETNNVSSPVAISVTPRINTDLVVSNVTVSGNPVAGTDIDISWTVTNQGTETAIGDWDDLVSLSLDQIFDYQDQTLSYENISEQTALAPNQSYTISRTVELPPDLKALQNYYLVFSTDINNQQSESDNSNNNYIIPLIPIDNPDLIVSSATAQKTTATLGETISVSLTVKNQGTVAASTDWYDYVYISRDTTLDYSDIFLGSSLYQGYQTPLLAGDSYNSIFDIYIPTSLSGSSGENYVSSGGSYYLLFVTDEGNYQSESNEANNVKAIALTISAPDLLVSNATFTASATVGEIISLSWTVTNQGTATTSTYWYDEVYVSDDTVLDYDDTYIAYSGGESPNLEPGSSFTSTQEVVLPSSVSAGDRYLLFVADSYNYQGESNEDNNVLAKAITINAPDLVVSAVSAPSSATIGETISVSWTVTNQGTVTASADWYDEVYFSSNAIFDGSDTYIDYEYISTQTPLAAGSNYTITRNITIPNTSISNGYLLFVADSYNYQGETNETNNTRAVQIQVNAPDLVVSATTAPSTTTGGETVAVSWTVKNQGNAVDSRDWFDYVYLSENATLDNLDTLLVSENISSQTPLAAGGSYTINRNFTIPNTFVGNRYLLFVADGSKSQVETDENNNLRAVQIQVNAPDLPDLIVTAATAPESAIANSTIDVSWTVTNQSNIAANTEWSDRIYISNDEILDNSDTVIYREFRNRLAANGNYTVNRQITLPAVGAGKHYLLFVTDSFNQQGETNENNNIKTVPIQLSGPDLTITATAPNRAILSQNINVSWTVKNNGTVPALADWYDEVYVSNDDKWDNSDIYVSQSSEFIASQTPLAPNSTYTITKNLQIPSNAITGERYLIFYTDSKNRQGETNENNNTLAIPISLSAPDLIIADIITPPTATLGGKLDVSWTVTNQSTVEAVTDPSVSVYLSPYPIYDYYTNNFSSNRLLSYQGVISQNPLAAISSYTVTPTLDLNLGFFIRSSDFSQNSYLIFVLDEFNTQGETNENNNLKIVPITLLIQDLVTTNVSVPTQAGSASNIEVAWQVTNQGDATITGNWVDKIYLSTDNNFSINNDILLGELSHSGSLNPSESYRKNLGVTLPINVDGSYYIFVVTDAANQIFERNRLRFGLDLESNNATSSPIQIKFTPYADLKVSELNAPSLTIGNPAEVTIDWKVTNVGTIAGTVNNWLDRIILSEDEIIGNKDDKNLKEIPHTGLLAVGESYSHSETILLPVDFQGRYRLFIQTDANQAVFEGNSEANNIVSAANFFDVARLPYADLQVTAINVDSQARTGQPINISWTVANLSKNQGGNAIAGTNTNYWIDRVMLASDSQGKNIVKELGYFNYTSGLGLDQSYQRNVQITLPNDLIGTYYLVVETSSSFGPFEFIYNQNNRRVATNPINITLTPPPDLVVSNIIAPTAVQSGDKIDVTWTVTNQGAGDAVGIWSDRIYLQEFGKPNPSSIELGTLNYGSGLEARKSYSRSEQFTLPSTLQGQYQIVILTNHTNTLYEHGATNNNTTVDSDVLQITLAPRPDLQIQEIFAPENVSAGGTVSLEFLVINRGTVATNIPSWQDWVYLSLDNRLSSDDILLGSLENQSALAPGESYRSRTQPYIVPKFFRGSAYLLILTDATNQVNEYPNDENNILAKPINVIGIPPSDLVTSNVIAPNQAYDGSTIEVRYKVTNLGVGETDRNSWTDTVWLTRDKNRPSPIARDSQFEINDILLGTFSRFGSLKVGESYEKTVTVKLPEKLSGEWYITPWTDAYNVVLEATRDININPDDPNELDNNNYKARPITVLLTPPPDLVVTSVIPTTEAQGDKNFNVKWTVKNQTLTDTLSDTWTDVLYLSDKPDLNDSSAKLWLLGAVKHQGKLKGNETYTVEQTFKLSPATTGQYVFVETNAKSLRIPYRFETYQTAWEGIYDNNNILSIATNVTSSPADLVITDININTPSEIFSGEKANIQWTVTNQGGKIWEQTRYWVDDIYISSIPNLSDPNIFKRESANYFKNFDLNSTQPLYLNTFVYSPSRPLGIGESYTQNQEIIIPQGIGGKYYIYVVTNPISTNINEQDNLRNYQLYQAQVFEERNNNISSSLLPVTYREADLQVTQIQLPSATPQSGDIIPVKITVKNLGNRDTREKNWIDRIYLSRDASLDFSDKLLAQSGRDGILKAGESYEKTINVDLPESIRGDFYILAFTDSNIFDPLPLPTPFFIPGNNYIVFNPEDDNRLARVGEYRGEGNNIISAPLAIRLATPPDLQVTSLIVPERVITGQTFNLTYTVKNNSTGNTPTKQSSWRDLIYLSRDQFLDLRSDRYLDYVEHTSGLAAGASYTINKTLKLPTDLTGSFYIFVITDPPQDSAIGRVFEGENEGNNATASVQPLIIELPPPSDLQVDTITQPGSVKTGDNIQLEWTVFNRGNYKAEGEWTDAVYLSTDNIWDINDVVIGRVAYRGTLQLGQSYTSKLTAALPPAIPGQYRIIIRPDIFNQVYEGLNEANNRTASADPLNVTVEELQLGVPLTTNLTTGKEKLFQVKVSQNQTLRVKVTGVDSESANELFLRFGNVPTDIIYDAAYEGQLSPNQTAIIPTTKPGVYYILVRDSGKATTVNLLADVLPFGITDVRTDRGGDSRYVTTTIRGAQFQKGAVVKLVRPGFAEYQPVRYEVIDSTKITAIFDLREATHGLYDVKVINPDGQTAIIPYRYLVERAIEPDVDIALGGPRVLGIGEAGTYGVSVQNLSNIDTPYVHFQFGVPELGKNVLVYGFPYLKFSSNLGGKPESDALKEVPWASLISEVNATGVNLAPGYIFDLATGDYVGRTFKAQTYPGLKAITSKDFIALRQAIYEAYPELQGKINKPEDLQQFYPPVVNDFKTGELKALEGVDPAFQFPIIATATALTRQEFINQQTQEALTLRNAILNDISASQGLIVLAADEKAWVQSYLAALELAGLLRPEDQAPPVRENTLVVSLMATLATGILAGPAGKQIITDGNLVSFFDKVRQWYGNDSSNIGTKNLPNFQDYDLGVSGRTHFEAFNIYVPFGEARLDLPSFVPVPTPSFARFFNTGGSVGEQATLTGPLGFGNQGFVPVGEALPYTISFENAATASSKVGEVRIVTQLDADLDSRTFELGDMQLGDIQVKLPAGRGSFEGTFDFVRAKGFLLRISAGLDPLSKTATWLLQAINPDTGEVIQDPNIGLLPANDTNGAGRGFVTYTVKPKSDITTSSAIASQARVIFNTAAPLDTTVLSNVVDAQAPTTQITAKPLSNASSNYLVQWQAADDSAGSGVKHVTVYVAKDGGNFEIWQRQTTATSAIYQGEAGHTYEFIALATDNAGNREQPRLGITPPDDGSSVNLGTLPTVSQTTQDLGTPPKPSTQPSTNPLFTEAEKLIPAPGTLTQPSEFTQTLRPFTVQAFATGITQSHGNIGPMAIATRADGTVIVSGGVGRNQLYTIPKTGGAAGNAFATLPHPIFDLAFDGNGNLWATTGGGPLLKLNPDTGAILNQYGDGITQALAIHPETGLIYLSSGNGVEIFDPSTATFTHYSNIRVGNMAFSPDGQLWAATWPQRGDIIRFDNKGKAQRILSFDTAIDSLTFGVNGTQLAGLLFISSNQGEMTMVDVTTLRKVKVAQGGSRGDIIKATADGRVLLSQSHQIDVLSPVVAPKVIATNPAPDANITLPYNTLTISFDQDMYMGDAGDSGSILNPNNFKLQSNTLGFLTPQTINYDAAKRTVQLTFDALIPDRYQLRVENTVKSLAGLEMQADYIDDFTAISDFLPYVDFKFDNPRSDRQAQTISYDVTITSKADYDLLLPLVLLLEPQNNFTGIPLGNSGTTNQGAYLIDLSDSLTNGRLSPGQSIRGKVITVQNPDQLRVNLAPGIYALPTANQAPTVTSTPILTAKAGETYTYQPTAHDPDGVALAYLLYEGPEGMTVDANTGLVRWTPTTSSNAETPVKLRVYDSRGGYGIQEFTVNVDGGNHQPVLNHLPTQILGVEGEPLEIILSATDADNNLLNFWADNLPGGAVFDPATQTLRWTPGYDAAGTYEKVKFVVSDGLLQASQTTTILIAPKNQAPTFIRPIERTVREGEKVRIQLQATDPEGQKISYFSNILPGGAKLNSNTGLFEWTPTFFQAGEFEIPFSVSDGESVTTQTTKITVLNVNAAPVFDDLAAWQVQEGQQIRFRAFALDPDNPAYVPPERLTDGSLTPLEGSEATVTYTVTNLPTGATFDPETANFIWLPGYTSAGNYTVTFTATDNGDGTGTNLSTVVNVPIKVLNTNRTPAINPITNQTINRGDVVDIPVEFNDPDGNPLTITAQGLPGFGLPRFATFTDQGNGKGLLRLTPSFDDSGDYTITLKATDDGDGGGFAAAQSQEYSFIVTVNAPNEPPHLGFVGDKVAVVGEQLQFEVLVNDKNQDNLTFSAVGLPNGATFVPSSVYGKAVFTWTPTTVGNYDITLKVSDSGNGDVSQVLTDQKSFKLKVRNANQAPILATINNPIIAEGQTLTLNLNATDADGDVLTYSAVNLPQKTILDPVTGSITWQTNLNDAGEYKNIQLIASDGNKSSYQKITIKVNNTNQTPVLIPLPLQSGRENTLLQFTIAASDLDGDSVSISPISQLPVGAAFNLETKQFTWTPNYDQAGDYTLKFAAFDPQGASSIVDVNIKIDNVNRTPSLNISNHTAVLGKVLKFNLVGADPDRNTKLVYSANQLPEGATLNSETGEFNWTPSPGQLGDYPITFVVTDGEITTTETVLIKATLTSEPIPVTLELTPSFPAVPGQKVLINALSSSLGEITNVSIKVNGQIVPKDAQGRGEFTPTAPGKYIIEATVTDIDGLAGTTHSVIQVRDPQDNLAPVVNFGSGLNGTKLTNVTNLIADVIDSNLDEWTLEIAPFNTSSWQTLASGETPVNNSPLTQLNPEVLSNGFYQLRLKATDISDRTTTTDAIIEINSLQKQNQYQRSETDLTVDFAGTTLNLVRAYDSLNRQQSATFGYGWRLANTDTNIQTNVPTTGRESLGAYNPFRIGTRLYLTLPNGQRVGFTFQPQKQEIPGLIYYTPAWVADPGVNYTLQSADAMLTLAGNRLYELKTAQPYNPASNTFTGHKYTLTAPDGTIYYLNAAGKVEEQITSNGVKFTYSDSGITSSTGEVISFVHDAQGRLSKITAPDSRVVTYTYDGNGNLLAVRKLFTGESKRYAYSLDNEHLLTLNAPAPGQPGAAITYNAQQPQILPIIADLGSANKFITTATTGNLTAGETQRYTFSVRASELRATETNVVLLGVKLQANTGSVLQPQLPVINGLTPLATQITANSAFALYALNREGLHLLEINGKNKTFGGYSLQLFIAGDVNSDGRVDGLDSQQLISALGSQQGGTKYNTNLDVNQDGSINATDVQILGSNYGFVANQAPVVQTTSILTHEDLTVAVPLTNLATDPDGDSVYYRVLNPINGTVQMSADGMGAIFTPTADYVGNASFELLADDGFGAAVPVKVTVKVSDAPLINIDIQNRNPFLQKGDRTQLVFIGDFTDQQDVILTGNYLALTSSNPTAATINQLGQVLGLADGTGVISGSRNGLQAVTAFSVGIPTDPVQQATLLLGLGTYPETLSLSSAGGFRQLKIDIAGQLDLSKAESGTKYFVTDPKVVSVSADGFITAKATGKTTITVINSGAEALIPVRVEAPINGPAVLGKDGGVVQGADGSIVTIGPGVLTENTTVSITPVTQTSLPLAVPDYLPLLGTFELNIGDEDLSQPAQLAIPVSAEIPVGAEVQFFRLDSIPDETGNYRPIWLLVETGVVGSDGFARTSSPPLPGVKSKGIYFAAYLDQAYRQAQLGLLQAQTIGGSLGGAMVAVGSIATYTNILSSLLSLPIGFHTVETVTVPRIGKPIVNRQNVEITPGTIKTIEVPVPVSGFDLVGDNAPVVTSLKLEFTNNEPELVLTGDRFNILERTSVKFRTTNNQVYTIAPTSLSRNQIRLNIPQSITMGLTEISVISEGMTPVLIPTRTRQEFTTLESNVVELGGERPSYVIAGNYGNNNLNLQGKIAFIDSNTQKLVANVSLPTSYLSNAIVVSPDLTRAYVPSKDGIFVIDTLALQQVDVNPDTPTIDPINLINSVPGANPNWAITDYDGKYLYVADQIQSIIYKIDIQPQSSTYNTLVETIPIEGVGRINRLAFNSNGTRLYATATTPAGQDPRTQRGHIVVINLTTPRQDNQSDRIKIIQAGYDPYAIVPTNDPQTMLFTNRQFDREGFGVLQGQAITYIPLVLGDTNDSFDVNDGADIAFLPAGTLKDQKEDYVFVAAQNFFNPLLIDRNPNLVNPRTGSNYPPSGQNIGIIKDPLGKQGQAQLVAATRPIPFAFSVNVALSPDGKYLYAPYMDTEAVFVYDVQEILNTIKPENLAQLQERPINVLNRAIDKKADYLALNPKGEPYNLVDDYPSPFTFGIPKGSQNAPIGLGGSPVSIATQSDWLRLTGVVDSESRINTITSEVNDLTPKFTWTYQGGVTEDEIKEVKLYVSVFPKGDGLLPSDRLFDVDTSRLQPNDDVHPNRILTATWNKITETWNWSNSQARGNNVSLTLSDNRTLTAGQTYYWAVEATKNTGQKLIKTGQFKTAAIQLNKPFNGVTIITHGFQASIEKLQTAFKSRSIEPVTNEIFDRPLVNTPQQFIEMGQYISKAGGGDGTILIYNRQTGRWVSYTDGRDGVTVALENLGKPLVLVPEWFKESDISDSGFAEAAADTFFAALMQLNNELNERLFASPIHFIGHSRGTSVNSEIIQRLGTFRHDIEVHMTTLDPHEFVQPGLDLPLDILVNAVGVVKPIIPIANYIGGKLLGKDGLITKVYYADFKDPDVQRWENVKYADNYYQEVAYPGPITLGSIDKINITPNGRKINNVDFNLRLDGNAGFRGCLKSRTDCKKALSVYAVNR